MAAAGAGDDRGLLEIGGADRRIFMQR